MKLYLEPLFHEIVRKIYLEEISPYPDLHHFVAKGKEGEVVLSGEVQHYRAEKIEKLAYGKYVMKGVEINGISIIPDDNYDLPIFACNLSSTEKGINMDVDFYPAKDLVLNYDYFEKYISPLKETYDKFIAYNKLIKLDSDFFWSRTIRSPYWIKGLCPEKDSAPFIDFSKNYLAKWLKLWKEVKPMSNHEEIDILKRRKKMLRGKVSEGDPGRARYFDKILEDKNIIQRITDAMI